MGISSGPETRHQARDDASSQRPDLEWSIADRQLHRWGAGAGLAGGIALLASFVVVVVLELPDASDVESLTDFADLQSGRIAEHLLYLGALMLFALHVFVLQRVLRPAHQPAALFATVFGAFGLAIMAASSLLHVSTAPLADLRTDPDATADDLRAIDYAWHGAQSVFDTMLTTGALLVPIGIVFFGLAMRRSSDFGPRFAAFAVGLGLVGTVGAVVGVVDPGSLAVAVSVLALVVFHLATGWRTLRRTRTSPG